MNHLLRWLNSPIRVSRWIIPAVGVVGVGIIIDNGLVIFVGGLGFMADLVATRDWGTHE